MITVVCTANVCRSPMAQALLRHALAAEPKPLNQIKVESAGVSAYDGEPITSHSASVLREVGVEVPEDKSKRLTQEHIDESFLILGMTQSHIDLIQHLYKNWEEKLFLFREFAGPGEIEIPDPFGMNVNAYKSSRDSMVEAIPSILKFIRTRQKDLFSS